MVPEIQHIAITVEDGSLAVMQFVTKAEFEREATDEAIEAEIVKAGIRAVSWRRIDIKDLPTSRDFRAAWNYDGKIVDVDMVKAREIHKSRMRAVRTPLLAAFDVEYQRADEEEDSEKKASIVASKQLLRDVTEDPAIAAAKTPEELTAVWPEILKEKAEKKAEGV